MNNGLELSVDFSQLENVMGTVEGIGDATNSPGYIGDLIQAAHNVASKEFDVDAASAAGPNNMSHMWEFGTTGITRGQTRFSDPTAPESRLWAHAIAGEGNIRNVFFAFRTAVVPNPKPDPDFYGVSSEVISKLSNKKYVFKNKATIIELGETVHIKPDEKKFNFVPFYGKPPRNPAYTEGYIFRPIDPGGPMASDPGSDSGMAGTFTAFWNTWWSGRGQLLVTGTANEYYNKDVAWILNLANVGKQPLTSVMRYNSRGRIYNRRRRVRAKMIRQAKTRGKVVRH